jgi:hypothetical protein
MKKTILFLLFLIAPRVYAGTIYISTAGAATNSGCTDSATPLVNLTTCSVSGTTIQFPGGTDLSGVVTSGATQSTVYIKDATNSNRKIFWIDSVNDGADSLTVTVAPSGVVNSSATIGGWHLLTNAYVEGAVRAGDTVVFNDSPAAASAIMWTFRASGDGTSGYVKIKGKSGVRPVLTTQDTNNCIVGGANTNLWIENLEIQQQGASGNGIASLGACCVVLNVKISDAGTDGIATNGGGSVIAKCEITGLSRYGIYQGNAGLVVFGNYLHDIGGYGIYANVATPRIDIINNIFDTITNNAFYTYAGGGVGDGGIVFVGNTVYGGLASGVKPSGGDRYTMLMANNIFKDNGNTASEYNVEWPTAVMQVIGFNNVLNVSGGAGGGNVLNYTLDASDFSTDPLFSNGAGGDFSLGTASPAKATGYPGTFLGGSVGYKDIGAVQRQEPAGGGATPTAVGYAQ